MSAEELRGKGKWVDDGHCYVCGRSNPEGMHVAIERKGRNVEASFRAEKRHQGYRGILHGGFLAMLIDEVLVWLPYHVLGVWSVTAEISVRLVKPVMVGARVRVRAFFLEEPAPRARVFRVGAECSVEDGTVVARGEGKCVRV